MKFEKNWHQWIALQLVAREEIPQKMKNNLKLLLL
jgi:hypothetical protein